MELAAPRHPPCDPLFRVRPRPELHDVLVSNLRLSSTSVSRNGSVTASVDVAKTGARKGDEVVQLYINDPALVRR